MKIRCSPMHVLLTVAGCGLLVMAANELVWSQDGSDFAGLNGDDGATASPIAPGASGGGKYLSRSHGSGTRKNGPPAASGTSALWLAAPIAIGAVALGCTAWLMWRSKRAGRRPPARSNALAARLVQTRLRETKPARVPQQQSSTTRRAA
jgi:hypothetical protein